MVGRWQSGAPLALSPERDDPQLSADPKRNNDFLYGDDLRGFKCPAGAHAAPTRGTRSTTTEASTSASTA
jgi:deferrochelatase/peroxidase EfeB